MTKTTLAAFKSAFIVGFSSQRGPNDMAGFLRDDALARRVRAARSWDAVYELMPPGRWEAAAANRCLPRDLSRDFY